MPKGKRRGKYDIAAKMLTAAAKGGVLKTHFMYKANLSQAQLERYLKLLIKKKFLEYLPKSKNSGQRNDIYRTTKKGIQFVTAFYCAETLWNEGNEPDDNHSGSMRFYPIPRKVPELNQ